MPQVTGRLEITLSARDPVRSAGSYSQLLGLGQTYDHTSDDGRMRYVCLLEPHSELVLCLVGHAANPRDTFSEFRTGLDHLEFIVARRNDLVESANRLDEMGVEHSGVKESDYTSNAMLTSRDPDNIQLVFLWRAPPAPGDRPRAEATGCPRGAARYRLLVLPRPAVDGTVGIRRSGGGDVNGSGQVEADRCDRSV